MAQLPADVVETLMNATPEEAAAITEAAQQQIAQLTELLTDEVEESETANLPVPANDEDAVWDDDAPADGGSRRGDVIDLAGADRGRRGHTDSRTAPPTSG